MKSLVSDSDHRVGQISRPVSVLGSQHTGSDISSKKLSSSFTPMKTVKALYTFEKGGDNELSVEAGQLLEVLNETDSMWWLCRKDVGEEGFVPVDYVEIVPSKSDERFPSRSEAEISNSFKRFDIKTDVSPHMHHLIERNQTEQQDSNSQRIEPVLNRRPEKLPPIRNSIRSEQPPVLPSRPSSKLTEESSQEIYPNQQPLDLESIQINREAWEREKKLIMEEAQQKEQERRLNEEKLRQFAEDKKFDELIKRQKELSQIAEKQAIELLEKKEFSSGPSHLELKEKEKVK